MPVRAIDVQSLKKDYRLAEDHLKSNTRELQPVS